MTTLLPDVPAFRAELRRKAVTKRRGFLFVTAAATAGVTIGGLWAQIMCLCIAAVYFGLVIDQTKEIHLLADGERD